MRKSLLFFVFSCALTLPWAWTAQEPQTQPSPPKITHDQMTQQGIQSQTRIQRNQRFENMPYLDKAIVRELMSKEEAKARVEFMEAPTGRVLEDYVLRAIKVHTAAKAAWERVALTRRRILVALRNLFPEARFDYGARSGKLSSQDFHSKDYRFTFKQPIFRGGALWNTLLQEKAALEGAENKYAVILGDLIRDVSKAYFEFHRAKKVIHDQEKIIEKMKPLAEISEQKFKQQLVSEIEHLHAQSLFGQIQYEHETAKQELELAKIELQKLVDIEIDGAIEVVSLYDNDQFISKEATESQPASTPSVTEKDLFRFAGEAPKLNLEELIDLAYQHRPELRMEAAKLEAARFSEKARWGAFMPQADVVLEFGKLAEALDVNTLHPGFRTEFRLMVEVKWNMAGNKVKYGFDNRLDAPTVTEFETAGSGRTVRSNTVGMGLLDGLDDFVRTKEAKVEKLDQIVELEKAEKEVVEDVKRAYFDYQKAQIQAQSSLQNINYLQRSAQLAEHRLEKNEIQLSEYLKAEIDLAEGLDKFHRSLSEYLTARAALNHAVGMSDYMKFGETHE